MTQNAFSLNTCVKQIFISSSSLKKGFHVKLKFLPLTGIQINLKKNQLQKTTEIFKPKFLTTTTTTTTTQEFIYKEYYKSERKLVKETNSNKEKEEKEADTSSKHVVVEEEEEEETSPFDDSDLVTVHRYMVFYDGKCRNCKFNIVNSTLDSDLLVDPTFTHAIKCHLKVIKGERSIF